MAGKHVSLYQASKMLEAPSLYRWQASGYVPLNEQGKCPIEYVQRLARFLRVTKLGAEHAYLCMLEWQSNNLPEFRASMTALITELLADRTFLSAQDVATLIGYPRRNVSSWAHNDFLMGALIRTQSHSRGIYVFLPSEVERVKQIMDSLTSFEAAEIIGVDPTTICHLAQGKRIEGVLTPDGWRFTPEAAHAYRATQRPEGLTQRQAIELLGVGREVLVRAAKKGRIPFTRGGAGHNFYDEATILHIKHERERLRGDFAQVPATLRHRGYSTNQTAQRLGISHFRAEALAKKNLVPHFVISIPGNCTERQYVAGYVDLLAEFASQQGKKISLGIAAECKLHVEQGILTVSL